MVVRGVHVDGEQGGERQKRIVLQKLPGGRVQLPEDNLAVQNFGGLVELGPSFAKPHRHPLARAALHKMRVHVIDGRVRVLSRGIQQDQDVVRLGSLQEQAHETVLPLAQVSGGLERLEASHLLQGEHHNRRRGIDACIGENSGEDGTHALELEGSVTGLFLGGVADHPEMRGGDFEPGIGLGSREAGGGGEKEPGENFPEHVRALEIYREGGAVKSQILARRPRFPPASTVTEFSSQRPRAPVPPPDRRCDCARRLRDSPRRSRSSACGRGRQ